MLSFMAAPYAEARQKAAAWACCLAGPCAWFIQLTVVFALATPACSGYGRLPLHAVSAVCLLTAATGGGMAWKTWNGTGHEWPESGDEPAVGRARLMGVVGVLINLLFAWIVCAQWIALASLDPCPP